MRVTNGIRPGANAANVRGHARRCRARVLLPVLLGAAFLGAWITPGAAAPPASDSDWPCQQRLVPTLGAGALWPEAAEAGDWRAEPQVAALVERIAPRRVTAEEGVGAIADFAERIARGGERQHLLPLAFSGLVDETNRERSAIIARLKDLGHRQRELADMAARAGDELRAIPVNATGEAAARRADLEQRVTYVTKAFESAQRTMRYACEIPSQLEARLGRYAEALKGRL